MRILRFARKVGLEGASKLGLNVLGLCARIGLKERYNYDRILYSLNTTFS